MMVDIKLLGPSKEMTGITNKNRDQPGNHRGTKGINWWTFITVFDPCCGVKWQCWANSDQHQERLPKKNDLSPTSMRPVKMDDSHDVATATLWPTCRWTTTRRVSLTPRRNRTHPKLRSEGFREKITTKLLVPRGELDGLVWGQKTTKATMEVGTCCVFMFDGFVTTWVQGSNSSSISR